MGNAKRFPRPVGSLGFHRPADSTAPWRAYWRGLKDEGHCPILGLDPIPRHEQVEIATRRIATEVLPHQTRQRIDPFPHVGRCCVGDHSVTPRQWQHQSRWRISRATAGDRPSSRKPRGVTRTRSPSPDEESRTGRKRGPSTARSHRTRHDSLRPSAAASERIDDPSFRRSRQYATTSARSPAGQRQRTAPSRLASNDSRSALDRSSIGHLLDRH